jgi:hypothetical protein
MAYDFNGTNQDIVIAGAPVTVAPLTMAFWANLDSVNNDRNVVRLTSSDFNNSFILMMNGSRLELHIFAGGNKTEIRTTADISTGVWFHGAGVFASTTSRTVYHNGGNSATNTTTRSPTNITEGYIGSRRDQNFTDGRLAEIGIWSADLTQPEIQMLAQGFTCDQVRPQSLVFYAPLVRDISDLAGGRALTNNGATVAVHPRIYS